MMNEKCLLSIIIPVYNVERYIEMCLNSIYEQGADESLYEIIVVNDGTKDYSVELAEKIIKSHPNSKLISQENQGLSMARNTGLTAAVGKYVWFIDSDDWLKPQALETILALEQKSDYDVITMPLEWSFECSNRNYTDIHLVKDITLSGKSYLDQGFPTGAVQRNIISRDLLVSHNLCFYPHILHEDGLFGPELYYLAKSIHVLSNSFYNYRQRDDGSIMHNITMKNMEDLLTVHKELMRFAENYVKQEDLRWFRTKQIQVLMAPYFTAYSLKSTKAFKEFKKRTRTYRRSECLKCFKGNSFINKIRVLLCAYTPMFWAYIRMKKNGLP